MVGQTISHYRVLEKLGEGGMGVVYKARETHLDRFVALKLLPAEAVANPERKLRFTQEARAASSLHHPGIITIYDIDTAEGETFIAMELVQGKTLDQLIGRRGLRLSDALNYAVQIADALSAAHTAGILHRDLKPANVMVNEKGLVKILDFGIAKLSEADEGDQSDTTRMMAPRTEEGTILGTSAYMSPEQAEGKNVDVRSDIFSFGSLLYEMVTGRRAFQKDTKIASLSAVLREDPQPPTELVEGLPRDLEKIIVRCLRKDVERRFQTMADVRVQLKEVKEESESGDAIRPALQGPRRWIWTAAALASLAIAATAWWLLRPQSVDAPAVSGAAIPLTSYPGSELAPSFSPDGSQVAFSWNGDKQDNYDIYVKLVGPGTPLRLTSNPATDNGPAWSPDGRWIAFRRGLSGGKFGLFLIPALGGPERKLLEYAGGGTGGFSPGISWHPDGSWLAFVDRDPPEAPPAVFAVSVTSGQRLRLTSPPAPSGGDAEPSFSPDSRALVFYRRTASEGGDFFVISLSPAMEPQGEPRQLSFDQREAYTPTWTADGREIIYAVGPIGNFTLWRLRVPGSDATPGRPERLPSVGQDGVSPVLSRQGNRLAYVRWWRDLNIWRVQIPGGIPTSLISSTRGEENPRFAPDGKKIAFRSDRSGHNEIWVSESDGANAVQLTNFGGAMNADLNWSPDGQRIAFKSIARGNGDIYVIDAEGGTPQRLTIEPSDDLMPGWSRDGKWIYFASNRSGIDQIWKMPATGGSAVQVTKQGGLYSQESPDGRFLYYGKGRNPNTGVWKMPVAGGDETRVLESITQWMNFQVVDQGIYFIPAGTEPAIQFLRLATGKIEPVVRIEKRTAVGLSVSPDGRTLLFTVYEQGGGDLMLVENFR